MCSSGTEGLRVLSTPHVAYTYSPIPAQPLTAVPHVMAVYCHSKMCIYWTLQLREDIQKNNINIYPILERHDLDEEEARTTSRIRVRK